MGIVSADDHADMRGGFYSPNSVEDSSFLYYAPSVSLDLASALVRIVKVGVSKDGFRPVAIFARHLV